MTLEQKIMLVNVAGAWLIAMVAVSLLIWREYKNDKFISVLMDRLMSKTLFEFKQTSGTLPKNYQRGGRVKPKNDQELAAIEEEREKYAT